MNLPCRRITCASCCMDSSKDKVLMSDTPYSDKGIRPEICLVGHSLSEHLHNCNSMIYALNSYTMHELREAYLHIYSLKMKQIY